MYARVWISGPKKKGFQRVGCGVGNAASLLICVSLDIVPPTYKIDFRVWRLDF